MAAGSCEERNGFQRGMMDRIILSLRRIMNVGQGATQRQDRFSDGRSVKRDGWRSSRAARFRHRALRQWVGVPDIDYNAAVWDEKAAIASD